MSGNGPTTVGEFFVAVVDRITDRIGDIVIDIEDRVTELEDTVVSAETAELRPRLAELRRESIESQALHRSSTRHALPADP